MASRFETSPVPKTKWAGGYKAGAIDPSKIADEVMGQVDGVRDLGFSPLGRDEGKGQRADRFEGAGRTPEYWYSAKARRAR